MNPWPITRQIAACVTALALSISMTACGESDTDSDDPTTLTVGFVVDPSWAQIPVAVDGGDFQKHHVNVKVINFSSGVEALQAVAAGQVDVTTAADVPTAATLTRSASLRVIADGSRWNGSRIVARRSAGISSINDLAGKSIGTPAGTSAAYFATDTLERSGVQANLVQVAPSAVVTAASKKDVDAIAIFQPYQQQVVQALGPDAVELMGGGYVQHSLYLATKTATANKAPALSAFFAALSDAGTRLASHSPDAVGAVAKATQLQPNLLQAVLPQFDFTLQLQPDLASELTTLATWAKQRGTIEQSTPLPDYAAFLEPQFLPKTGS